MAVEKIPQYNRIIDLTLESDSGQKLYIQCPRRGRKPSIELNASYAGNSTLMPFNIAVKNLYLDLLSISYAKVKLKVGYENNTIDMEGTILTIYQESPGPEGRTIIQCQMGNFTQWLDAAVQIQFDAGTKLMDVLEEIRSRMGALKVEAGETAKTLSLKSRFDWDGTARGALAELEKRFEDNHLHLFMRNEMICAICYTTTDYIASYKLDYMSAPPQPNAGGEEGTAYTTITAPWIPQLNIGDMLEIPQQVYMRYLQTVNAKGKATQFIQVTSLSLHFGTTGGVNSMTVQGFNVR